MSAPEVQQYGHDRQVDGIEKSVDPDSIVLDLFPGPQIEETGEHPEVNFITLRTEYNSEEGFGVAWSNRLNTEVFHAIGVIADPNPLDEKDTSDLSPEEREREEKLHEWRKITHEQALQLARPNAENYATSILNGALRDVPSAAAKQIVAQLVDAALDARIEQQKANQQTL